MSARASRRRGRGVVLALSLLALSPSRSAAQPAVAEPLRVLRVWPQDDAQHRRLLELAEDPWSEHPGRGSVDVRVSAATHAQLQAEGFALRVLIADPRARAEAERHRIAAAPDPAHAPAWFSEFRDWPTIDDYLDTLEMLRPDLVQIEAVGSSIEGREIRALRIAAPELVEAPGLLVVGTQHAREWLSPMAVTCVAEALVSGYDDDPEISSILDRVVIHLLPVANPDGYVYSWDADRYWRKNRREDHGVDLNRNWNQGWGGPGGSLYPDDENYVGQAPHSEPEVAALVGYIEQRQHLVAELDVHTYAHLVLYPWSYRVLPPPDEALLTELASRVSDAMAQPHGFEYEVQQGAELYTASGTNYDWIYGQLGIAALALELRGEGFVVPPEEIEPACEETLAAVLELGRWAAGQRGPLPPAGEPQGDEGGEESDEGGELPPLTSTGDDTMAPGGTASDGTAGQATSGGGQGASDAGCGCTLPASPSWSGSLLLLMAAGLRRRSRPPA